MSVWQPIATAPKDGRPVLVLLDGFYVYLVRYGYPAEGPRAPENACWFDFDFADAVCVAEGDGGPLCWAEPPTMTFEIAGEFLAEMKRRIAARESKIG